MTASPADPTSLCIASACAGDNSSRDRRMERFTPVLAQARHRLSRPIRGIEPEDLVQECWASALPKLRDLAPREGGWTATLLKFLSVRRRLNDQLRRHARRRECEVQPAIEALAEDDRRVLLLHGIEQPPKGTPPLSALSLAR